MSLLFRHAFETRLAFKFLKLAPGTSLHSDEVFSSITKVFKMYDPKTQAILYRLPKTEL